jgi:hypothetical protein
MVNPESWANERDTPPEGSVRYREEIRRELDADNQVLVSSRKAIILSRATLARCIVRSPTFVSDSATSQ